MRASYGITPALQHQSCMVDVFPRSGHLDKAIKEIKQMSCSCYVPAWFALLGACEKWGNKELGRSVFERLTCFDNKLETISSLSRHLPCTPPVMLSSQMATNPISYGAKTNNYATTG